MRVILPPLDKYLFFHPACLSILFRIDDHMAVDLNRASNGKPNYFMGTVYI